MLAAQLDRDEGGTAATQALAAVSEGRLRGLTDDEIVARWPVTLALVPPRIGAPAELPEVRLTHGAPQPMSASARSSGCECAGCTSCRPAPRSELGRRLAARHRYIGDIADLTLDELIAVTAGDLVVGRPEASPESHHLRSRPSSGSVRTGRRRGATVRLREPPRHRSRRRTRAGTSRARRPRRGRHPRGRHARPGSRPAATDPRRDRRRDGQPAVAPRDPGPRAWRGGCRRLPRRAERRCAPAPPSSSTGTPARWSRSSRPRAGRRREAGTAAHRRRGGSGVGRLHDHLPLSVGVEPSHHLRGSSSSRPRSWSSRSCSCAGCGASRTSSWPSRTTCGHHRTDAVLGRLREHAPEPHDHFAWLRDTTGRTNVFLPVLLGAGVLASAAAWVVEHVARVTTIPALERRLAERVAVISLPAAGLVDAVPAEPTEAAATPAVARLRCAAGRGGHPGGVQPRLHRRPHPEPVRRALARCADRHRPGAARRYRPQSAGARRGRALDDLHVDRTCSGSASSPSL